MIHHYEGYMRRAAIQATDELKRLGVDPATLNGSFTIRVVDGVVYVERDEPKKSRKVANE